MFYMPVLKLSHRDRPLHGFKNRCLPARTVSPRAMDQHDGGVIRKGAHSFAP
jgi:hypothetical protein